VVWFRRAFTLDGPPDRADLVVTADNGVEVFLDGESILVGGEWWEPTWRELTEELEDDGEHLLAARVNNTGGPAAFLAELTLTSGDATTRIVSDEHWQFATVAEEGWEQPEHDDSTWQPARELARLGGEPWTALDATTWALAPLTLTPQATPAEELHVAQGFEVELLHSALPDEGSWVAMCFDDRGRMIVSDHYDGGLFRVTLPGRRDHGHRPGRPDPIWSDVATVVEPIDVDLSSANGLLWWDDALLVMVCRNASYDSGLYRVSDSDGDDQLDTVELLVPLQGGGDHGWHALVPHPDGRTIVTVAGNNTTMPELDGTRVPRLWDEDILLPRLDDPTGFMASTRAPGGCLYRIDPEGRTWELLSIGYRNPYDAAFHRSGDLFTFDADMEWDLNTPWYRPTRLCLVSSGSEYGWRSGSGKWPSHHLDGLPPVAELGPGSPVGVAFGYGAFFPERWADALYLADWSYGTVHAVHLAPDGSAWQGESEVFLSGAPLPVTDLAVNPKDGALYLITGGRNTQTGVYRVSHRATSRPRPKTATAKADASIAANATRALRLRLESWHGREDPEALATIWPALGHDDRFVRYAARVALEWQPVTWWRDEALDETDPRTSLTALAALARTRGGDVDTQDLRASLLQALGERTWEELDQTARLDWLRVHALAFTRLGPPDDQERELIRSRLQPVFPAGRPDLDGALCELLAYLQSPTLAHAAVPLLQDAPTREQQLDLARSLRTLDAGWTDELRAAWFTWLAQAERFGGGMSMAGFVRQIREDALAHLTPVTRADMEALTESMLAADAEPPAPSILAGRTTLRDWRLDELLPAVEARRTGRDFTRGRALFGATDCFRCHRMAGEGGAVGPDLTSVGSRFSARELLASILDPSETVSDQYERTVITTTDDRVTLGTIVNHHGNTMEVRTDMFRPGEITRIDRRLVQSIEPSSVSAMPEGLLGLLTEDEVADLVAYVLAGGREDHPAFR
jgi:putative heme-binding domain-containing protein